MFLDKMRLEPGRDFVRGFCSSLCCSRVAAVVLSAAALRRMTVDEINLGKEVCEDRRMIDNDDPIIDILTYSFFAHHLLVPSM